MHFVGAHSFAEDPATACVVCGEAGEGSSSCWGARVKRLLDLEIDESMCGCGRMHPIYCVITHYAITHYAITHNALIELFAGCPALRVCHVIARSLRSLRCQAPRVRGERSVRAGDRNALYAFILANHAQLHFLH